MRELWKFADVTGAYGTYYGTQRGAESKPPPPPCANRPSGMVVEIDDYRKVDDMVERLIRWILHDNLDVEVILRFRLPPTQRFCYE